MNNSRPWAGSLTRRTTPVGARAADQRGLIVSGSSEADEWRVWGTNEPVELPEGWGHCRTGDAQLTRLLRNSGGPYWIRIDPVAEYPIETLAPLEKIREARQSRAALRVRRKKGSSKLDRAAAEQEVREIANEFVVELPKILVTCNRCGAEHLAWAHSDRTGRGYLVQARLRNGKWIANRREFHSSVCTGRERAGEEPERQQPIHTVKTPAYVTRPGIH